MASFNSEAPLLLSIAASINTEFCLIFFTDSKRCHGVTVRDCTTLKEKSSLQRALDKACQLRLKVTPLILINLDDKDV